MRAPTSPYREMTVLSGKGGTGKSCITAAFAHLAHELAPGRTIIADLDVDAPDLHILLAPDVHVTHDFVSGHEARIDPTRCTDCGMCAQLCAFGAISRTDAGHTVDPLHCEGCKVCVALCPAKAVDFLPTHCGEHYESTTRLGPLVHARLFPGQENSGRLVALLRRRAHEDAGVLAATGGEDPVRIIADGSPGVGCPVISALTGTHAAIIVTEPTPSGLHDLERVGRLCDHFRVPAGVIINRADLNPDKAMHIRRHCEEEGHAVLGTVPHDDAVIHAMLQRKAVTEAYPDAPASRAIATAFQRALTFDGTLESEQPYCFR